MSYIDQYATTPGNNYDLYSLASTPQESPSAYSTTVVNFANNYMNDSVLNETPTGYMNTVVSSGYVSEAFTDLMESMDDDDDDDEDVLGDAIDYLSLAATYQREKEDKKHRMGDLLALSHSIYKNIKHAYRSGNQPTGDIHPAVKSIMPDLMANANRMKFYDWLDAIPELPRIMMIAHHPLMRIRHNLQGNLAPSMVVAFLRGVAYLDAQARQKYALTIQGIIMQNGVPFTTENMSTVHSGKGYAIWVAGGNPVTFYAGNHVKGQFHHSSFLAGEPVVCGGEMVARAGKILLMTGKTGHYQAQTVHFARAMRLLQGHGVDPASIKVQLWNSWSSGIEPPIIPPPTGDELIRNPSQYDAWRIGARGLKRTEWDT